MESASNVVSCDRAREIMGMNFFGIEEWENFYGAKFSQEQRSLYSEFPWSEEVLLGKCPFDFGKKVRETHFAFLGLDFLNGKPLTISELKKMHPIDTCPRFGEYESYAHLWLCDGEFADRVLEPRWYLVHSSIIQESTKKAFREQEAMLSGNYSVPFAIAEIVKALLFYRKRGVYPHTLFYKRCADVLELQCVHVGSVSGIVIGSYPSDIAKYRVSIAAERKPHH